METQMNKDFSLSKGGFGVEYDAGLRSYMTSIYNWMAFGLLISAGAAYISTVTGLVHTLAQGGLLFWVVLLAPFALIFYMGAQTANKRSGVNLAIAFVVFTALEGLSMSVILTRYGGADIAMAFSATAATFVGMSLWGYTTKRNLSGFGSFILMALIGLIVTSIIATVLHSALMTIIVSIVGIVIFAGIVAYDTQTMRNDYAVNNPNANARKAIWHALNLYLDFLNIFLFMLRLMGGGSKN
jgi:FtsH-binding integral membrane protein